MRILNFKEIKVNKEKILHFVFIQLVNNLIYFFNNLKIFFIIIFRHNMIITIFLFTKFKFM